MLADEKVPVSQQISLLHLSLWRENPFPVVYFEKIVLLSMKIVYKFFF